MHMQCAEACCGAVKRLTAGQKKGGGFASQSESHIGGTAKLHRRSTTQATTRTTYARKHTRCTVLSFRLVGSVILSNTSAERTVLRELEPSVE